MTEQKKDLISGSVFLILSIILFIESYNISYSNQGTLGPEFVPRIVSIIIFFLAGIFLILTLRGLTGTKKTRTTENVATKKPFVFDITIWGTCALVIIYPLFLKTLGFIIVSTIFLFGQIFLFTDKSELTKGRIITICIISLATPVLLYYLFNGVFYIFLPSGILG